MTREEAKEWLPIIQAWAEGKPIQYQISPKSWWTDINKDLYISNPSSNYRIKPESKYRPFKNQEECWNEMLKHQPFGWIKNEYDSIFNINSIFNDSIQLNKSNINYSELCTRYKFIDGTPFGIKE